MLPRSAAWRWCVRAPAVRRSLTAAAPQRRHFLPSPADVQKALEEAQRALAEAGQRAKEETDKAAKVFGDNFGANAEKGRQALEQAQQEVLERAQEALESAKVLEKAQEALENAKQEADRTAQVINETLQQAAKGQPGFEAVADQKVHVLKGLEVAAEQGAQLVNAALAAAGSAQRFGGAGQDRAAGRPPAGSTLFWSPDAPDSPSKVGRDAFIARCMAQASTPGALVPDADVEQYVDFLLASAVLSNSALPQAVGRHLYVCVVRLTQRAVVAALSGLEGQVLGRQMRLLWEPSPLNAFRHSDVGLNPLAPATEAQLDPRIVDRLAARTAGDVPPDDAAIPACLKDLGLDSEKLKGLHRDVVALTVRILMDIGLTKQVRCLGHEITFNVSPDDMLHTAPGWDVPLEEGVFGTFGEAEKRRLAGDLVEAAAKDPSLQMVGLSDEAQREVYTRVLTVLLGLSEVALNHLRVHVAGMAFRPCLVPEGAAAPPPHEEASAPEDPPKEPASASASTVEKPA